MSARSAQNAPCHVVAQKGDVGDRGAFFGSDISPSFVALGSGLQDHRLPWNMYAGPAGSAGVGVLGWFGEEPVTVNVVPKAVVAGNIAPAANVVNGTAMVLTASVGAIAITAAAPAYVLPGFAVQGRAALTSGLALDGLPGLVKFGRRFIQGFYDRATMLSRAVSVTGVAGGAGGAFIVSGYDCYGYPMSEKITVGAGAVTQNGKKAFKIISSVVPQFTDAHNYSIQTTDIIGLGILTRYWEDTLIIWNGASVNANTGFVACDTTNPATNQTGDVRGTYALQSASDGVKRLSIQITPSVADIALNPTTGIFGQTQA